MSREFWKPSNLLAPVPAAIITSADSEGHTDMMTAAWVGTVCSDPVMVSVSIRPSRLTHDYIEKTGEFVVNLTTEALVREVDWVGVKSGRDVNKWEATGLAPFHSQKVRVPGIEQSPICLECVVSQRSELGSHTMYVAEVLSVDIDSALLDEHGRLDIARAHLICYAHGEYFALGESLGKFGFSVKKR